MKKRGILAAAAGALVLSLFVLAKNPVIIGGADLPQAYLTAIESQAQGIYSRNVPLVPVCVTLHDPLFSLWSCGNVLHTLRRL